MTEEERRFNEEALNTDLCDLLEKYSGEMGVPVFAHLVTSFIADLCMDGAPSEHTGISVMLRSISEKGLAYERAANDWRNDV